MEDKPKRGYICGHSHKNELENPNVKMVGIYPTLELFEKDHNNPKCGVHRVIIFIEREEGE